MITHVHEHPRIEQRDSLKVFGVRSDQGDIDLDKVGLPEATMKIS